MSVLDIFSSQFGLTLWTVGVSAAMVLASALCIYLLPWRETDIKRTHTAVQNTLSPLKQASETATATHIVKVA